MSNLREEIAWRLLRMNQNEKLIKIHYLKMVITEAERRNRLDIANKLKKELEEVKKELLK